MADRRRINGPAGGTTAPTYTQSTQTTNTSLRVAHHRPTRTRDANELRKIFLKTGLAPSASGSAYLELEPSSLSSPNPPQASLIPPSSALKLTCTVHGPRPLPRSAPFTPHILLSTHVKFAPFAARQRKGYIRDASERDLAVHLETALRGVIIGDRWPKSGVEVVITVLEGEEDYWWGDEASGGGGGSGGGSEGMGGIGLMTVLAGCITVASAAIADAGIDCVDLVSGGVAAIVGAPSKKSNQRRQHGLQSRPHQQQQQADAEIVLDPCPSEHEHILAMCIVAHLPFRDEITELWFKGDLPCSPTAGVKDAESKNLTIDRLVDQAIVAASGARTVLEEAVREAVGFKLKQGEANKQVNSVAKGEDSSGDVEMGG